MSESNQEFSSTSSEDDVESSLESSEGDDTSITGEIVAYQDEPLANSDDNDSESIAEDSDEDGLAPATLQQRFEKTEQVTLFANFEHLLQNDTATGPTGVLAITSRLLGTLSRGEVPSQVVISTSGTGIAS